MAKHEIMDHTGHSTIEFDKAKTADLDAAMKRFEELVGEKKMLAVTREPGDPHYTVAKTFRETKTETLFRPQMAGG